MTHLRPTAEIVDIPTNFNNCWNDFKTDGVHCTNAQLAQMFQAQTKLHRRIEYLQMRVAYLNQYLNHETAASLPS